MMHATATPVNSTTDPLPSLAARLAAVAALLDRGNTPLVGDELVTARAALAEAIDQANRLEQPAPPEQPATGKSPVNLALVHKMREFHDTLVDADHPLNPSTVDDLTEALTQALELLDEETHVDYSRAVDGVEMFNDWLTIGARAQMCLAVEALTSVMDSCLDDPWRDHRLHAGIELVDQLHTALERRLEAIGVALREPDEQDAA